MVNPGKSGVDAGGEGVRRRLMALGFHKGDIVELDGPAISA
jgi:Fe2+ transport system protein FeoA